MSYTRGYVPGQPKSIVLDMQRMNRVLEINTEDLYVVVEPAVTWQQLHEAMAQLSPADREILLLRSFRDLDTAEVVEILGISAEAIRQRYSRAVKRLGIAYRDLQGLDGVSV